jgi:hypothetical protein
LDNIEEGELASIQVKLINEIWSKKLEMSYRNLGSKYLQVNLDGVEHFNSKKISCPCCLERHLRDGSVQYYHSLLAAVLVHPDLKEVLPLETESILRCDGDEKNDCERNAAKRLLKRLKMGYPEWKIMIVADALYACSPLIELMEDCGFAYILNVKPDSHKSLFSQFEGRKERGNLIQYQVKKQGENHYFEVAENLLLCSSSKIRVHFMKYQYTDAKGKTTTFSWILPLHFQMKKHLFMGYMRAARARWKIENETFNTLKNQGYYFEHNFGHGQNFLASNFAILMFLAFTIDQIQQWGCTFFKAVYRNLRTKLKLWEILRAVFKIIEIPDMKTAFINIASLFNFKIE